MIYSTIILLPINIILSWFGQDLEINGEKEEYTPLYQITDPILVILDIYKMTFWEKGRNVIYCWLLLPLIWANGSLSMVLFWYLWLIWFLYYLRTGDISFNL